jgi:uracil phosphoribosyltransferase
MTGVNVAELNPKAEVLSSAALDMLLSVVRDKATPQKEYVAYCDRLASILAEEGLARLATPTKIVTPCGELIGLRPLDSQKLACVDIVRSGGIILEAVRKLAPDSKTAKILIQRDEETALPQLFYSKLPPEISELQVIMCDPMLGTGGSSLTAINVLKEAGVREENILFLNMLCALKA